MRSIILILSFVFCHQSYSLEKENFKVKVLDFFQSVTKTKDFKSAHKEAMNFYSKINSYKESSDKSFDRETFKLALGMTLEDELYDTNSCLAKKMSHFSEFGVRHTENHSYKDLPPMVRESYIVLMHLCRLKDKEK